MKVYKSFTKLMSLKEHVDFLTQNKIELIFSKLVTSHM